MDPQTFGAFVAENRKALGLTQAGLAQQLQVTAKAVSRWERGKGYPDIHTIQPLAKALGLSVLELMESRRRADGPGLEEEALRVMEATLALQRETRRQERTALGLGLFTLLLAAALTWSGVTGNLGGGLFVGAVAAVPEIALYYGLDHWEDRQSRRVYGAIAALGAGVLALLLLL